MMRQVYEQTGRSMDSEHDAMDIFRMVCTMNSWFKPFAVYIEAGVSAKCRKQPHIIHMH